MPTPVTYKGSPYHKRHASPWGPPQLASDKSACPDEFAPQTVAELLPAAIDESIATGLCSQLRDSDWPRYAWGRTLFPTRAGGTVELVWEARVENRGVPEYKAYPVTKDRHAVHMPAPVRRLLWPA